VASVTIGSAGEKYEVTLSSPVVVTGDDERFSGILASLVEGILGDYSPSLGGQASFVASQLKERLGVAVFSVNEPPAEKGVVY
jgi:hypothetical protein